METRTSEIAFAQSERPRIPSPDKPEPPLGLGGKVAARAQSEVSHPIAAPTGLPREVF